MTAGQLAKKLKNFPTDLPISDRYQRELTARAIWSAEGVWYKSQKEHWLGWLSEYDGPGAYGRKTHRGRSANFIFNHIVCPPMLLWLAEAVGVAKTTLRKAKRAALSGPPQLGSHCAALRRIISWEEVEARLRTPRSASQPEVLHLNLRQEFFAAIAVKKKRIEYRQQSPHWRKRLEGRAYDAIQFRNGYLPNAPEMLVEFRGLRRYGAGRNAYYAIRLGEILWIRRWRA